VSNKTAYALDGVDTQSDMIPENGVSLSIDTSPNNEGIYQTQMTNSNTTSFIKVNFTVGANKVERYDVYVQADTSTLVGKATGTAIQSVSTPTKGSVASNSWGYGLSRGDVNTSDITYKAMPASVSTAADSMSATTGTLSNIAQLYTLAFAANLKDAAVDHYKSSILLSVAAGAGQVAEISETLLGYGEGANRITEMQQMTPTICNTMPIGTEGRLKDARDGIYYFVTRLNDGLCWMTQNLVLDLNGVTLTPADSDVTSNWTSATGASANWGDTSGQAQRYYNPGYYALAYGTTRSDYPVPTEVLLGEKEWLTLSEMGLDDSWTITYDPTFVEVTEYDSTNDAKICTKPKWSMIGYADYAACRIVYYEYLNSAYYYNLHYLQGNYYTWPAAKAGSTNTTPDTSICPKNWKLPTNSSFNGLQLLNGNMASITPYFFTYSGMAGRYLWQYLGGNGYYWSATNSTSTAGQNGYHTLMGSTNFSLADGGRLAVNDYDGFGVRCVVR